MRLAALLAHPEGLQFGQKYVSVSGGPGAGSRLRSAINAAFELSDPPALYLKYKLPAPADAAQLSAHCSEPCLDILAASSYDDAAQYILNYDSNALLDENGDCVSVDANKQPALWVLIKQQQAAAAAAAAAVAAQGQAGTHGATAVAAAAGAGLQASSTSTSAGSSASAATNAASGKPPGQKLQAWMEFARDMAARLLLCVLAPADTEPGTSRGVLFIRTSQKMLLGVSEGERSQHTQTHSMYHC